MSMNVVNYQESTTETITTGSTTKPAVVRQKNTAGAAHVNIRADGSPTSAAGQINEYMMTPADANLTDLATNGATKIWADATGCKAFELRPSDLLPASVGILVAWSTVVTDDTVLATALNAMDLQYAVPTGAANAVANGGMFSYTQQDKDHPAAVWDGTTTIKCIAVRYTNGVPATLTTARLRTVE